MSDDLTTKVEEATRFMREKVLPLEQENRALKARLDDIELKYGRSQLVKPDAPGSTKSENKPLYLSPEDKSFLRFIRKGEASLGSDERKALVEDSTGQYLVSPAIEAEIQRSVEKLVVMRQLASKRTIDKDRILVRDISEASVNWGKLETGTDIPESNMTPGAGEYKYVEDLYGLVKFGEDELEDSDFNLSAIVADSFARAISEKENEGFLKGTGHTYEQPDGITLDTTLVAAAKTTADDGVVTVNDFMQMIYEVPAKYRPGSAWIVNSLTELELRKLRAGGSTTTDGPYLWQPSVAAGLPATFLGYPIYDQDDLDDLSDTEGVIAIFGNFARGYQIIDRKGVTVQRLNELYAEAGLIGFKVHARVGGYLIRPANKALVLLKEHSA